MRSSDWMWIDTPRMNCADIARWWAEQEDETQAEFLGMMMNELERTCSKGGGSKVMQLHSIGKYLGLDRLMGVALDLREMVEASGYGDV